MDSDDREVKLIIRATVALPPESRRGFISEICNGRPDLAKAVTDGLREECSTCTVRSDGTETCANEARTTCNDDVHGWCGRRVGQYTLQAVIGRGATAVVFRARQDTPDRDVALKLLLSGNQYRREPAAKTEARLLAKLQHPNIAHIYEAGVHRGETGTIPYIAMEYVPDALDLLSYAELLQIDVADRVDIFVSVCDAVQAAHVRGVFHCDLKPAHILVDVDRHVKVIDFGIAEEGSPGGRIDGDSRTMLGTPPYASPEQYGGAAKGVDLRTDVFALGVVLSELLLGIRPTMLSGRRFVRWGLGMRSRSRLSGNRVDHVIAAIIMRASSADPESRYQSVRELAQDVKCWWRGEPVIAAPPSVWQRMTGWARNHPVVATAAFCVSVAAMSIPLAYAAAWWTSWRPHRFVRTMDNDGRIVSASLTTATGRTLAVLSEREGNVVIADLITCPKELVPKGLAGRVAVIATDGLSAEGTGGQLWVCDPNDLTTPLFRSDLACQLPAAPAGYEAAMVAEAGTIMPIKRAVLADVFPGSDHPGPEVIALLHHGSTPSAVRIYSLRCEVLFEAWHFGPLREVEWWPEPRLIVTTGDRHGKKTHTWHALGETTIGNEYPHVVMGWRPVLGTNREWFADASQAGPDSVLAWYKAVWPPIASDLLVVPRPRYKVGDGAGTGLELTLRASTRLDGRTPLPHSPWTGDFTVQLDANGTFRGDTLRTTDSLEQTFGRDRIAARRFAEQFTLVDFPNEAVKRLLAKEPSEK